MELLKLNNGVEMPMIGYGTYRIPPRETECFVTKAIETGYRSIDTAQCYGNEDGVGKAVEKSGLPRDCFFLTTKTWTNGYRDTTKSIDKSLKRLRSDYIDLLLIHEPTGDIEGIYRALEDALRNRKVRAIGVSNFLGNDFDNIVRIASVVPAINQVETHILRQQEDTRIQCKAVGTKLESWSPLVAGQTSVIYDDRLKDIANRFDKTPAQILLRWLIQRGIPVIPKSLNPVHMKENLEVFDFCLEPQDMKYFEQFDLGESQFGWW